ncbi:hypothetical protein GCM10023184_46350 [Flaviaesturariibacter amylovorans]|uniref:Uncharacterized protein n=2 Tax=Flaviaesturariibacter amylovorans TaxID=1084520 RepID=A0ABP8HUP6_9BACT
MYVGDRLMRESFYQNGKRHGEERAFDTYSRIAERNVYHMGTIVGPLEEFDSGRLRKKTTYVNGDALMTQYFDLTTGKMSGQVIHRH